MAKPGGRAARPAGRGAKKAAKPQAVRVGVGKPKTARPARSKPATVVTPVVNIAPRPVPVAVPPLPPAPTGPSSHDLAVEVFERGFAALQQRKFDEAAGLFSGIFDAYPEEKELHERARVYLAICERQAEVGHPREPRTFEERMNAATVAINRGAFEEARDLLSKLDPGNDLVHYMLAVVHAALGDAGEAMPHLQQALELNPENRYLALQDSDLEPLRQHPEFLALLEAAASSPRRPAARVRTGR